MGPRPLNQRLKRLVLKIYQKQLVAYLCFLPLYSRARIHSFREMVPRWDGMDTEVLIDSTACDLTSSCMTQHDSADISSRRQQRRPQEQELLHVLRMG